MSTTQEKRNSILKDLKNLLIWISIALIIRWQVIEPRWIPSGSMLPTLQIQDKILVEKLTPKITSKSNLSKLKNNEIKNGFSESVNSQKNKGKKIKFFNLGPENNWKKILDKNLQEKLSQVFEKDLDELEYF